MRRYEGSWWWVKEKKHMALVFIAITMMLQLQIKGCVGCLETERIGLLQLKSYLNSLIPSPREVRNLESWSDDDLKSDCCLWERVKCSDAIGGHIVDLSLFGILPFEDLDVPLSLNLSLLHSFPQLKTLDFAWNGFNHFFDHINGYKSFQRLENLRTLILSYNRLNNSALPFLTAARSLRTLNLQSNTLEGVPPLNELANMTELKLLNLGYNRFNSSFSFQGLINLRELEVLDLGNNFITDIEAADGLKMTKLKTLYLDNNSFSNTAQLKGLENLVELKVLILALNNINYTRSIEGLMFPSSLQVLDLAENQWSWTPKGCSKICALKNLRELDLSYNVLTSLPYCLHNLSHLRTLDLSGNQLNGNLSSFVYGLPSALEYLSLLQNNFNVEGVKDTRFNSRRHRDCLSKVELSKTFWSSFYFLRFLKLSNNQFQGSLGKGLLSKIGLLDLSHNKFNGIIPSCLGNMSFGRQRYHLGMETIGGGVTFLRSCQYASHLNYLKGSGFFQLPPATVIDFLTKNRDEAYQGNILDDMYGLDLSSNQLSGEIPVEIGSLHSIRSLNFSNNYLTGSIPDSISKLKDLESLDLSSNKLDGNIPTQLAGLNSLGYFNVSFNNLSGEIPLNGHLLTFGEMSYIGNARLCGPPTNKSCNPVPETSASKHAKEEEEEEGNDTIYMVWFYWTCGAVYISTLLALFAFLCIDSRWSREWFYRVDLLVHLLVHHLQRFKARSVCN
ncbi:hypothetical protein AALP_AA1G071400 [Arabis alpina]|uniref:Leucine-rich repeat-containing N-terminal plant-type domain-containing protein n=1 Tax=Arabis alpina TaxID=50452 RepID=A0A087HLP5_ARAAL|nr:hypothetical protein AALP_AA1G071400 [Arabis alpina]